MTPRPDPMQLPETGGYLLEPAMRVWLTWSGVSTIVAVGSAYAVGILIRTTVETGIVLFAIGCAWSALTPTVIRAIRRRLRG